MLNLVWGGYQFRSFSTFVIQKKGGTVLFFKWKQLCFNYCGSGSSVVPPGMYEPEENDTTPEVELVNKEVSS